VVSTPLKNISQWEGLSHILWKIKAMFETTNQHNVDEFCWLNHVTSINFAASVHMFIIKSHIFCGAKDISLASTACPTAVSSWELLHTAHQS